MDNGGTTPLMMACQENHLKVAIALLSQDGIAVNKPMDDGSTPLIMASYCGNSSVVEQLLLVDNITTTNMFLGKTAYDCANAGYRVASCFYLDEQIDENGRVTCQRMINRFLKVNRDVNEEPVVTNMYRIC